MVNAFKPKSLNEALRIMDSYICTVFAGGTDLMVKRKTWSGLEAEFSTPVLFLDRLDEIKGIKINDGMLEIGAACTFNKLIESPKVPQFMKQVFLQMSSPAIRNIATIGGNICNSSPAGDSLPLLYALDAILVIDSIHHSRRIHIHDFITGPGKNTLSGSEILTSIRIPLQDFDIIYYKKVGTRKSNALSKLSFTGFAKLQGLCFSDIRISFGAVGPTVVRDEGIEKHIIEMSSEGSLDMPLIKNMYGNIIKPIDDQRSTAKYRKETALKLLENFLRLKKGDAPPLFEH